MEHDDGVLGGLNVIFVYRHDVHALPFGPDLAGNAQRSAPFQDDHLVHRAEVGDVVRVLHAKQGAYGIGSAHNLSSWVCERHNITIPRFAVRVNRFPRLPDGARLPAGAADALG